jgi:hypothetical protein
MKTVRLPIPAKHINGQDTLTETNLRLAKTEDLARPKEVIEGGRYFHSLAAFVKAVTDLSELQIKKLPIRSAEPIAKEGMDLLSISDKMTANIPCPECSHINNLVNTRQEDKRIDIENIPVKYAPDGYEYDDCTFTLKPLPYIEPKEGEEPKGILSRVRKFNPKNIDVYRHWSSCLKKTSDVIIKSITFHYPLLGDAIRIWDEVKGDYKAFERRLYINCIVSMNYDVLAENADDYDLEFVIKKYSNPLVDGGLLNFEWEEYFFMMREGLSELGMYPYFPMTCELCGAEWEQQYQFMSFFVLGLLPSSSRKAAR